MSKVRGQRICSGSTSKLRALWNIINLNTNIAVITCCVDNLFEGHTDEPWCSRAHYRAFMEGWKVGHHNRASMVCNHSGNCQDMRQQNKRRNLMPLVSQRAAER